MNIYFYLIKVEIKNFKMRINLKEREALRERVKKLLLPQMKKTQIIKHFLKERIAQRTIYATIERLESGKPINDKKRTGRPTSWTPPKKFKLKRLTNNRKRVSQRILARKFKVSQPLIGIQLKKMGTYCYKREKTPKYTEQQALKAKDYCAKLSNLLYRTSCFFVMDDEKYFTFNGSNMSGNYSCYTNDQEKCSDDVRFVGKEKYPKKVLVWLAFSSKGISVPLFRSSTSEAIKSSIYVNK